jgi:hypothetical protein
MHAPLGVLNASLEKTPIGLDPPMLCSVFPRQI